MTRTGSGKSVCLLPTECKPLKVLPEITVCSVFSEKDGVLRVTSSKYRN